MKIRIRPLTTEQIRAFIGWEYTELYAMYNIASEDEEAEIRFFSDPENGYFAITDVQGELLGFCNFGADARVPGGDYSEEAIDIGMGMRPDLTGQGHGELYARAVFEFARRQYPQDRHRVTIAGFNQRAQRLCQNLGFIEVQRFSREKDGHPFMIMIRELPECN